MAKPTNEYLDEERKKLWQRLLSLKEELNERIDQELVKTSSDYSSQARQASKMATEYKNKSEQSRNLSLQYANQSEQTYRELSDVKVQAIALKDQLTSISEEAKAEKNVVKNIVLEVEEHKSALEEDVEKLEKLFEDFDELEEKLSNLNDLYTKSDERATQIDALQSSLMGKKKEFDQLYLEVFGYYDKGTNSQIEGLRDKLRTTYDDLKKQISTTVEAVNEIKESADNDYASIYKNTEKNLEDYIFKWNIRLQGIEKKIESLLPNALTAGLSSAYSEKRSVELEEYKKFNLTFITAICLLVAAATIPFIVSYFSFANDKPLEKVLLDMPRLVLSILPLYVPVL